MGRNAQRRRASRTKRDPGTGAKAVIRYNSSATLERFGPLIKASWSVPLALAQHLAALGRPVPPPVAGYLLIDTGAGRLSMALDVAQELQLQPVAIGQSYGAHGLREHELYEAHLTMTFADRFGTGVKVENNSQVMGVPDLHKFLDPTVIRTGDDYPRRMIGLLGRDFLQHATLTYRGSQGIVEIVLDLGSISMTSGG